MTNEELVNSIYEQMFNRLAEPAGLEFYTTQLELGTLSFQNIVLGVLFGIPPGTSDEIIFNNKVEVSEYFTNRLRVDPTCHYSGEADVRQARKILRNVDESSESVERAKREFVCTFCACEDNNNCPNIEGWWQCEEKATIEVSIWYVDGGYEHLTLPIDHTGEIYIHQNGCDIWYSLEIDTYGYGTIVVDRRGHIRGNTITLHGDFLIQILTTILDDEENCSWDEGENEFIATGEIIGNKITANGKGTATGSICCEEECATIKIITLSDEAILTRP